MQENIECKVWVEEQFFERETETDRQWERRETERAREIDHQIDIQSETQKQKVRRENKKIWSEKNKKQYSKSLSIY